MLEAAMTLGLIIALPVLAIVTYGFWLAGQLGRGPLWRRPKRPAA
jgi:hypothetical protein